MVMTIQIINILLYLFLFLYWRKLNKKSNIGIMIVPLMLLMTSVLCAINSYLEPQTWHLTLFPFIYLFISFCILLLPLRYLCPQKGELVFISNLKIIKILVNIFIVLSLSTLLFRFQEAINAFSSGDWLSIRTEMYQAETPSYNSFFERLSINGSGFLSTLGMVYYFYCLSSYCLKKKNGLYMALLASAVLLPPIISSISNAARGSLFFFGIKLLVITLVFYNHFSNGVKKKIKWGGVVLAVFFFILSLAITLSRFSTDSNSSLLYYFGHAMNAFNYGVMDSLKSYSGGQWFWGDYYSLFSHSIGSMESNGTHFSSSFITIIGCLLIDFGPIYSIIMIIVIVLLFSRKHNNHMDISDVYLYIVFSELLIEGVFVCGLAYGTKLLVKLLIYYVIANKLFVSRRSAVY